jgi:DNA-binding SARP family transcriptional activator
VEPFPPASEDGGETSDPADELPVAIVMAAVSGLGLLGAGVWRIVARRRTQAIGSRRPGTVPLFKPPPGAEAFLVRTSDDRALSDLDRGLRALAAAIGPNSAMPDLVGVVIEPATIILLLDSPHRSPPAPFTVDEDGRVWRLDRAAHPGPGSHRAEAPFPALVTVGHTERSQLLLNLEHAGVVNVSGRGPEDVIDTMATMALELATSPVADTLEILCVGFGRELAALERVTAVDSLAEAVERIETHAATVAALVAEVEVSGPAGRAAGIGGDTWTPLVVFDVASGPGQTGELIRAAGETVDSGVTAVVTAAGGSRWSIRVSGTEISLPFLGVTRRRRNLTLAERRDLVRTIGDAARPASIQARNLVTDITANAASHDPASQPAVPMVPAVLAAPAAPPWEVRIVVRVLGPLSVEKMEGAPVRFGRGSTAEFVAYLSHHRRGVSIDAAMEALWPNAEPKRPWINNLSSDARKALGTDGEGRFLLPRMTGDGLFRLSPLVGTDLERFEQLVDHASGLPPAAAVEILKEALGLVAGPPFGGMSSSWALLEGVATHAMLAVDEAARALATIALDQLDDPIRADWATRQGLLANPRSNELHLLRLRSVLARGSNESAAESVFQRYRSIVLGDDDQPEGGSELDPRIVELYSSFRRTRPANWVGQRAAAGTWPGGDHHPPMPGPDRRLGTGGQPPHPAS